MELMVRDGDYVIDENGALRRAEGSQELLQRVMWKLSIPRGSFPLLPGLGSELYLLGRAKPSQRSALAAKSALHGCGKVVLEGHIRHCVLDGIRHGDPDKTIESFTKAVERFSNMG